MCVQEVRKKSLPFPFTFFLLFRLFRIFVAKQMDCVELQLGRGGIDFFYEKKKIFLHTFEFDEENPSQDKLVDTFFFFDFRCVCGSC